MPLLLLWLAYEERMATGTSLAAIVVIALFAAVAQGAYGNVDVLKGIMIGVPAVIGVIAGASLQQRVSTAVVSGVFAVFLVASAAFLIV